MQRICVDMDEVMADTLAEHLRRYNQTFEEAVTPEDLAGKEVLKELSARFDIFIATQAMVVPNSLGPKYRWLQRHFPFIPATNYVFCGDKSILRADYLIDDQPRNLVHFEGTGLLYTAPHNLTANGFIRVDNWQQVAEYFARFKD